MPCPVEGCPCQFTPAHFLGGHFIRPDGESCVCGHASYAHTATVAPVPSLTVSIVSVRNLILQNPIPSSTSFTEVLNQPLPFKIPAILSEFSDQYPDIFIYGRGEYDTAVDTWLSYPIVNSTSENCIVQLDMCWHIIIKSICMVRVLVNQKDASSNIGLRSDTVIMKESILLLKGESKASDMDATTAFDELVDKFHADAYKLFPRGCTRIPGIVTTSEGAYIRYISYFNAKYTQTPFSEYGTRKLNERVQFIVAIFKLCRWIIAQTEPIEKFHLVPGIRIKTRNGHHVTWIREGILKEFHHPEAKPIPMDIIQQIYNLKLPNVEHGKTNHTSITITRVGTRLCDTLGRGVLDKSDVANQIHMAINQLHLHGFAHCDICVDNIFVDSNNIVFLGDLEYCQLKDLPPPTNIRRADSRARTGEELDNIQFDKFRDELARV